MQREPQFGPISFGIKMAEGESSVDRDAGVIKGLSIVTEGLALGHGIEIDETFVSQLLKAGESFGRKGVKSRFGHPGFLTGGEGRFLGSIVNFRKDGNQVRADLQLSKAAESSPLGNLKQHLLDLAEHDPDKFGMSIVFDPDEPEFRRNKNGKRTRGRDGEPLPPLARLAELQAVDFVDSPAANAGGMFTEGRFDRMAGTQTIDLSDVTLAEFEAAHPDKIKNMKADAFAEGQKEGCETGREEGRAEIIERVGKFAAEFGDDARFAIEQLGKGATLVDAQVAYNKVLRDRNTEMAANLKQAAIDAGKPSAYSSDVTGGKAGEKAEAEKLTALQAEYDAQHESFREGCTFESFCAAGDEIDNKGGGK